MREYLDVRVKEANAQLVFATDEGERLSSFVRSVRISTSDPRMEEIAKLQRRLDAVDDFLIAGWKYHRQYEESEWNEAPAFQLLPKHFFEPAGEECGTVYDDSEACPICGAGRRQISPLRLDLRKVPRKSDFASTIADELIVSQRAADAFLSDRLRGVDLIPVEHVKRRAEDPLDLSAVAAGRRLIERAAVEGIPSDGWEFTVWLNSPQQQADLRRAYAQRGRLSHDRESAIPNDAKWYQVRVAGETVGISPRTRAGNGPFESDSESYLCPAGHTIGLNLLSEVFLTKPLPAETDVAATEQHVGTRQGLLAPRPLVIVSQRLRASVLRHGLRGFDFEVARLDHDSSATSGTPSR